MQTPAYSDGTLRSNLSALLLTAVWTVWWCSGGAVLAGEPPVFQLPTNNVYAGSSVIMYTFRVTDADSVLTNENLRAWSGNEVLVTNWGANLHIVGDTNAGLFHLFIIPTQGQEGTAEIYLSASDESQTITNSFTLHVRTPPPPRLIANIEAWWGAEGNARDARGVHDAMLMNGASFAPGILGQAFDLDGVDDYVQANPTADYVAIGAMECWIYPRSFLGEETVLISKQASPNGDPSMQLSLIQSSEGVGVLRLALDAGTNLLAVIATNYVTVNGTNFATAIYTNYLALTGTKQVFAGAWTHVAFTLDSRGIHLYVDGVLDQTLASPVWMSGNDEHMLVGKGSGALFDGLMDEVVWYSAALDPGQVDEVYQFARCGKLHPPEILAQPQRLSAGVGEVAQFQVTAVSPGGLPLSYQWKFRGNDIPGAYEPILRLTNLELSQSGEYSVTVSNAGGSVNSRLVDLAVAGVAGFGPSNLYGQLNTPRDLMNVTAIAAGEACSLALRNDGLLFIWGFTGIPLPPGAPPHTVRLATNSVLAIGSSRRDHYVVYPWHELVVFDTQGNPRPGGTNGVAFVSVTGTRAVFLMTNGTAFARSTIDSLPGTYPLPGISNVVAVSAGGNHCLALLADGTVLSFAGRTNVPPGLSNVVAIAAGYWHDLALREDGTIVSWGGVKPWSTHIPAEATNVVAIAANQESNYVMRSDGSIYHWGNPDYGFVDGMVDCRNAVSIAVGSVHMLALLRDGTPQVTIQPGDKRTKLTARTTFVTKVVGKEGTSYQWYFNSNEIPGATFSTYEISNVSLDNEGEYSLVASNSLGIAATRKARLRVEGVRPATLRPIGIMSGNFAFSATTQPGFTSFAQWSSDLRGWSSFLTNAASTTSWEIIDPSGNNTPQRFYRVMTVAP